MQILRARRTRDDVELNKGFEAIERNARNFDHANRGFISVSLGRIRDHIEIRITDTGIRIAPEFLQHVFEDFSQQDGSGRAPAACVAAQGASASPS